MGLRACMRWFLFQFEFVRRLPLFSHGTYTRLHRKCLRSRRVPEWHESNTAWWSEILSGAMTIRGVVAYN